MLHGDFEEITFLDEVSETVVTGGVIIILCGAVSLAVSFTYNIISSSELLESTGSILSLDIERGPPGTTFVVVVSMYVCLFLFQCTWDNTFTRKEKKQ